MEMNHEKIEANAGNNSVQLQASTINIQNGCSPTEVMDISRRVFEISKQNLIQETYAAAQERVERLTENLIPRIEKLEQERPTIAREAFKDPAFLKSYVRAQQAAACTDLDSDYELLAELLKKRIESRSDRYDKVAIDHAIQVVDEVADDALLGLTAMLVLLYPCYGNLNTELERKERWFKKCDLNKLPSGREWIDHLELLGLLKTLEYRSLPYKNRYISFFFRSCSGYECTGVMENSKDYNEIKKRLQEIGLDAFYDIVLVKHELRPGYLRMNISDVEDISNLVAKISSEEKLRNKESLQSELVKIYNYYFSPENTPTEIKNKLSNTLHLEISKKTNLFQAVKWYDNIKNTIVPTTSGNILVALNAQQIMPDIMEMFLKNG